MSGLNIVFGTAGFNPGSSYPTPEDVKKVLDIIYEHGVRSLDTAQLYGASEEFIGKLNEGSRFNIDTKSKGGFDGGNALLPDTLYKDAHTSLERLNVKQVDIFYVHAPDETLAPATWLPTLDKLHKEGVFKRLGLSNFHPHQVQEVYEEATAKGLVLPSVFQGNYGPVARKQEDELFPLLRKYNIAFYAYSPLAGGFLAKTKKDLQANAVKAGRFSGGPGSEMYKSMYLKPTLLDALEEWEVAAKEAGASQAELAYRWVAFHSPLKRENGDAIIFGARNIEQAVETVQGLGKGPLKESVVSKIEEVWDRIKDEAPLDNFHSFFKATKGLGN